MRDDDAKMTPDTASDPIEALRPSDELSEAQEGMLIVPGEPEDAYEPEDEPAGELVEDPGS